MDVGFTMDLSVQTSIEINSNRCLPRWVGRKPGPKQPMQKTALIFLTGFLLSKVELVLIDGTCRIGLTKGRSDLT